MNMVPSYVHFASSPNDILSEILVDLNPDLVAVLVDEHTAEHCYPKLSCLSNYHIVHITSGEDQKNLQTCEHIWSKLTGLGFSRQSILINLGGGVIGDMGGFVAATYKRGIRFINVPTTLLSQIDASIGGKLGIDFMGLKNHIGVFREPDAVVLWVGFLETLPVRQLKSGYAEAIKHGLIQDEQYWNRIRESKFPEEADWTYLLRRSVEIKSKVVISDPKEGGLRKILNFGHTLGHALETWYLKSGRDILHGEAIAVGMIMESWLSYHLGMIDKDHLDEIENYLDEIFERIKDLPDKEELFDLLSQDKKNRGVEILFALIDGKGNCAYDIKVSNDDIIESVYYYQNAK